MPDPAAAHHVSSAVVSVRPERVEDIARAIAAMPDTEVPAFQGSKIVVLIEGPSSASVADRLARIALPGGVIAATMVFGHVETVGTAGRSEGRREGQGWGRRGCVRGSEGA